MNRLEIILSVLGSFGWAAPPASTAPEQFAAGLLSQVVNTEGSVEALDLTSNAPTLLLQVAGGKTLRLSLDPKITSVVWGNGWMMRLDRFMLGPEPERLQVSRDVVMSHVLKDGVELATSIHILGARRAVVSSTEP